MTRLNSLLAIVALAACSDGGNGPGDSAPAFDVPVRRLGDSAGR